MATKAEKGRVSIMTKQQKKTLNLVLTYLVIILIGCVLLFPIAWMISAAFKTNDEIFGSIALMPKSFSFQNFIDGWKSAGIYTYATYFINSFIMVIPTTLLTIAVTLAGMVAFFLLPVAPLPEVDFPVVRVQANMPGASPETMASTVATPLERALGRIAGVTEMTSSSSLGSTRVILQFDLDRDINGAARDVQAAINAARSTLPTMPTAYTTTPEMTASTASVTASGSQSGVFFFFLRRRGGSLLPAGAERRGGSAGEGFSSAKKSSWAGCTGRDAGAFSARRSVGRLSERSVLI